MVEENYVATMIESNNKNTEARWWFYIGEIMHILKDKYLFKTFKLNSEFKIVRIKNEKLILSYSY